MRGEPVSTEGGDQEGYEDELGLLDEADTCGGDGLGEEATEAGEGDRGGVPAVPTLGARGDSVA